ncbi:MULTISPECIES: hypothetical protein [Phaeobacter]|uniref:hypothetical protein n=1 Tax=Phaeobacter TaxID=302485 RepID=UPI000CA347C9|nr:MULTISPECIES: hypothetical protein [Phaeobacter]AUQ56374.1 hypothetical protein PhaeoP92_03757 [Phaeobacter inhibens]AUQ80391.1 hypothetical protein PhaeoP74_03759 [Phaeobacter inhibens]AUR17550.1 hypothetical protein PhaeoP70_03757 [Phaeobacter inhibens]AUR37797.1 hypothetical protein PhaeoP18_03580 [Phaeobacter piscinae]
MRHLVKKLLPSVAVALTVTGLSLPMSARAQTYPIDCAILLCISGGWPASVPCARARAEFIRRITPWPVEPPLQIWRCPMGASYETAPLPNSVDRIFEALFQNNSTGPRQSFPARDTADPITAAWRTPEAPEYLVPADQALRLVQDRADINISGPEFNFVRSIRVFDVRYARQRESGRDGDCNRSATVVLGTYGTQGDFAWQRSSIAALPSAHFGLERWGQNCPNIYHSSVFVDWRDYEGNYGFEQVNY